MFSHQRILIAGILIRAGILTLYFIIPSAVPTKLEYFVSPARRRGEERGKKYDEGGYLQISAVPTPTDALNADLAVTAESLSGSCSRDRFPSQYNIVCDIV